MTVDDELAHHFEPRASSPTQRLKALRTLKESGIETYAFISPYVPQLSNIEQLVQSLHGSIDEIGVEALNVRGGNWTGVEQTFAQFYPDRLSQCKQLARDDTYWDVLEEQARNLAAQFNIAFTGFYRH
jgi:DNA repair photolyase